MNTITIPQGADRHATLTTAAAMADLDAACAYIQHVIGQTDGGIAAIVFCNREADYAAADARGRALMLSEYLDTEQSFSKDDDAMTFKQWQRTKVRVDLEDEQEALDHLADDLDVTCILSYECGWIAQYDEETREGPITTYYVICGRSELHTADLELAERFLWDNHSKYETAAK